MAIATAYNTGTASVANGKTAVTGQGTTWLTSGIQAGDLFCANGLSVRVASVNSNTSITLVNNWPDTTVTAGTYEIRFTPDATRVLASARQLIDMLANGTLAALASVGSAANKFAYYTGSGVAALGNMIAGTVMFSTSHIPHMTGNDADGYVRINNKLNGSDVGGSIRLYTDGTFGFWFDEVERFKITTAGKVTTGTIEPNRLDNQFIGGNATPYWQINGRADGNQSSGASLRLSTVGNLYLAYDNATVWNVNTAGRQTSGSVDANLIGVGSLTLGSAQATVSPATTIIDGFTYVQDSSARICNNGNVLDLQRTATDGVVVGIYRQMALVGSISATASAVAYNTTSDWRLKTDVTPLVAFTLNEEQFSILDSALLRVMLMRPVSYHWIADPNAGWVHGFIAHELQQVAPHAVTGVYNEMQEYGDASVPRIVTHPAVQLPPILIADAYTDDSGVEHPAEYAEGGFEPEEFTPAAHYAEITEAEAGKIPNAVWTKTGDRPVHQKVDHSKLVADTVAALQSATLMILEQREWIVALETRITALEAA